MHTGCRTRPPRHWATHLVADGGCRANERLLRKRAGAHHRPKERSCCCSSGRRDRRPFSRRCLRLRNAGAPSHRAKASGDGEVLNTMYAESENLYGDAIVVDDLYRTQGAISNCFNSPYYVTSTRRLPPRRGSDSTRDHRQESSAARHDSLRRYWAAVGNDTDEQWRGRLDCPARAIRRCDRPGRRV